MHHTCPSPPAAPGDYEDRSYQVVFNVTTQMGTLVVFTETDNIIEKDENFTAVLSVPAGLPRVFEGTPSEATVTILDQTTAEVYFDPATYNVTEGQPADLILRLTRDVDPSVTIIVRVQTRDGSATGVYTWKYHPTQTCTKTKTWNYIAFLPCSLQMVPTTLVVCTLPYSVVAALLVCECQHYPIMFLKDWRPSPVLSKYLLKPPPTTESQPAHLTLQLPTLQMLPVSLAFVQQATLHTSSICTYIDNAQLYLLVLVCQSMSLAAGVLLLVT